jgi:hypothetical protein
MYGIGYFRYRILILSIDILVSCSTLLVQDLHNILPHWQSQSKLYIVGAIQNGCRPDYKCKKGAGPVDRIYY